MAQARHNCHLMALPGASLPKTPEGPVPASVVTDTTPGPELCAVMLITAGQGSHPSDEETQAQEGDDLCQGAGRAWARGRLLGARPLLFPASSNEAEGIPGSLRAALCNAMATRCWKVAGLNRDMLYMENTYLVF